MINHTPEYTLLPYKEAVNEQFVSYSKYICYHYIH